MAILHTLLVVSSTLLWIAESQRASVVNNEGSATVFHGEYCEGETFTAECAADEAVVIVAAKYGRMGLGRCITISLGSIGCHLDVLTTLDQLCSGRPRCDVRVSAIYDNLEEEDQPCSREVRSYLDASYTCVKVISPTAKECLASPRTVISEPGSAFLSSLVTETTGCGSLDSPWEIRLPQGQRVKLTVYDFNTRLRATAGSAVSSLQAPKVCHVYAVIKEESVQSRETVCGSPHRKKLVYTSVANVVEVRFVAKRKDEDEGYFLMKYEAIGCPELQRPVNGWLEVHDDMATGGCNGTNIKWQMQCDGSTWSGTPTNCTAMAASSLGSTDGQNGSFFGLLTGSQWAAIVIIAAIAVTLGLIIFLIGLVYLRRKRSRFGRQGSVGRQSLPDYYSRQQAAFQGAPNSIEYSSKASCNEGSMGGGGYMGGGSTENDYFRTWQMQRHPPGARPIGMSVTVGPGGYRPVADTGPGGHFPPPPPPHMLQYPSPSHQQPQHIVEHIYESPKFDRKRIDGSDNVQYYELDPHLDEIEGGSGGGSGGGRIH